MDKPMPDDPFSPEEIKMAGDAALGLLPKGCGLILICATKQGDIGFTTNIPNRDEVKKIVAAFAKRFEQVPDRKWESQVEKYQSEHEQEGLN